MSGQTPYMSATPYGYPASFQQVIYFILIINNKQISFLLA
jgi:hypothetical protein